MESISTRRLTRIGVSAALYVAVTLMFSALSYQGIQFRFAEALMLLCLFSKDFVWSLTIGCFIANIFSPVGAIDVVVGTAATLLACICIYVLRDKLNLVTASVFPVVFNAVLVGLELWIVFKEPLFLSMGTVAIGEIVCVTIFGSILFKALSANKPFMEFISDSDRAAKAAE